MANHPYSRQSNLYNWNPTVQPPAGVPVEVDWSHPLAAGLVGCFVPTMLDAPINFTAPSIRDVSGVGASLSAQNASCVIGSGPLGIVAKYVDKGWYSTTTAAQRPSTGASVYCKGYVSATASNAFYPYLIGVAYDASGTASPYTTIALDVPASDNTAIRCAWAVAGSQSTFVNSGLLTVGNTISAGLSVNPNGGGSSARFVFNGSLTATAATASGTISSQTTSPICFNGFRNNTGASYTGVDMAVGYVWNRPLSDGELAWIHAEPYAPLRPVARRRWSTGGLTGRSRMIQ